MSYYYPRKDNRTTPFGNPYVTTPQLTDSHYLMLPLRVLLRVRDKRTLRQLKEKRNSHFIVRKPELRTGVNFFLLYMRKKLTPPLITPVIQMPPKLFLKPVERFFLTGRT